MADGGGEGASGSKENEKIQANDPRLDFFSDQFDPFLALNTPDIEIPDTSAKRYDNLAIYHAATDKEKQLLKENAAKQQKPTTSKTQQIERKFLPHQMPVVKQRVKKRNLFTRMEAMKGPLALLRKCKDERLMIKIWTRHAKGIRGYCLGYVAAFDKHWNIALEDVTEFWTRPKKRKIAALDDAPENERLWNFNIKPPKVRVTPHETDKKLENCTRQVKQFMMRGEHIVLISVIEEDDANT